MTEVEIPGQPLVRIYTGTLASGTVSFETTFKEIYGAVPFFNTATPPAEGLGVQIADGADGVNKKVTITSSNATSTANVGIVVFGRH